MLYGTAQSSHPLQAVAVAGGVELIPLLYYIIFLSMLFLSSPLLVGVEVEPVWPLPDPGVLPGGLHPALGVQGDLRPRPRLGRAGVETEQAGPHHGPVLPV